jgi:cbb3-type cytochrome oxidase subunit 3
MNALLQLADFGTDYTGIGWLTLALPLALLFMVVAWWNLTYRRGRRRHQAAQSPIARSDTEESKAADS